MGQQICQKYKYMIAVNDNGTQFCTQEHLCCARWDYKSCKNDLLCLFVWHNVRNVFKAISLFVVTEILLK